jgi:peptidoglycan hydrolase-like protein with peptidoglycan-binding domain
MKTLIAVLALMAAVIGTVSTGPVAAQQQSEQEVVWIQIEAHPSLSVAQERARLYSGALADVNGFSLGGTWYGILLGPYTRTDAEQVLRVYRREGQIPRDSFVARTGNLGQQFWPVGANILNRGVVTAPVVSEEPAQQTATAEPVQAAPEPADETPAQARRSEGRLTRDERKDLQIALQAAGFYDSAIDGAFGRGTRRSMAAWQAENGYEQTGILTTLQRQALMNQYNAPLLSVGMQTVRDDRAGIEMQLPTGVVRFSNYESPFAHYGASTDLGARVLLISQPGDRATLFGLYDILQTLEVIPLEGPRERKRDSFKIEGRGNGIVSVTEVTLKNGEIKGFTLVWPEGDDARQASVLGEMRKSFTRVDGVLDPAAGAGAEQRIDLVSGLKIRKPRLSRSGFFVSNDGAVITTASAVDQCSRITLNHDYQAEIAATDAASGLALLRPVERLAPMAVAQLTAQSPRLQTEIAVAGFSYEGALGAPTMTFGKLADLRGLQGEPGLARLDLAVLPGDAGGPVLDGTGAVLGMLAPELGGSQRLPEGVSFAVDATKLRDLLSQAGIGGQTANGGDALSPNAMSRLVNGMTVLVSCWD